MAATSELATARTADARQCLLHHIIGSDTASHLIWVNDNFRGSLQPFLSNKRGKTPMDWSRIEGNWKQVKGHVKEKWGKLADDELDMINGRREQLEGKIQERYGVANDQAKRDVGTWYNSIKW
jgi:uncharacterized protein YjbJ (UPF0337 family)